MKTLLGFLVTILGFMFLYKSIDEISPPDIPHTDIEMNIPEAPEKREFEIKASNIEQRIDTVWKIQDSIIQQLSYEENRNIPKE